MLMYLDNLPLGTCLRILREDNTKHIATGCWYLYYRDHLLATCSYLCNHCQAGQTLGKLSASKAKSSTVLLAKMLIIYNFSKALKALFSSLPFCTYCFLFILSRRAIDVWLHWKAALIVPLESAKQEAVHPPLPSPLNNANLQGNHWQQIGLHLAFKPALPYLCS